MNLKFSVIAAGLAAALVLSTAGGAVAYVPRGAAAFCAQSAEICRGGGSNTAQYSPSLLALLKAVNGRVNSSIRYTAERGGQDVWQLNPRRGDCEDYAISKRAALIDAGISPNSLRVVLTLTRRGAPHAVLMVRTSKGDYILDNERGSVRTVADANYRILGVSGGSLSRWN